VPAREIAEKLVQRLRNAWDPERRVHVQFEGDLESLDERRGFALALALNELVTNAVRHGFPDHRAGTLAVRLASGGDRIRLEVEDNGIGIASTQLPNKVIGSGRSIVHALVKDELDGSVDYHSDEHGTRVTVEFPAQPR
jgi:two-component sensor histidine kinase